MSKIAILYQKEPPPKRNGIQKPMKRGGYSDSGADIAYCLKENGCELISPNDRPNSANDYDWVSPDSNQGIQMAIKKGANEEGQYFLFDLNMKPNMTGASREHRQNQDSLTMLSARKIGWNYFDLLKNILNQKWKN